MQWWWLSFSKGPSGFLGVAIVGVNEHSIALIDGFDPTDTIELLRERGQEADVPFYVAVQTARLHGINPGGEVQGHDITDSIDRVPEELRYKLLGKRDLEDAGLI